MENQRRRFEKEKEDAFEYGGFSFAKEALNLIDNLDRSKHVLKSDDKLKKSLFFLFFAIFFAFFSYSNKRCPK